MIDYQQTNDYRYKLIIVTTLVSNDLSMGGLLLLLQDESPT